MQFFWIITSWQRLDPPMWSFKDSQGRSTRTCWSCGLDAQAVLYKKLCPGTPSMMSTAGWGTKTDVCEIKSERRGHKTFWHAISGPRRWHQISCQQQRRSGIVKEEWYWVRRLENLGACFISFKPLHAKSVLFLPLLSSHQVHRDGSDQNGRPRDLRLNAATLVEHRAGSQCGRRSRLSKTRRSGHTKKNMWELRGWNYGEHIPYIWWRYSGSRSADQILWYVFIIFVLICFVFFAPATDLWRLEMGLLIFLLRIQLPRPHFSDSEVLDQIDTNLPAIRQLERWSI